MTRGILIAGNESSLFRAASGEAAKRVEAFASVLIPSRLNAGELVLHGTASRDLSGGAQESAGRAIPLTWNPASAISARTLVLAAENRLKKINDAILICSPPAVFKTAEALSPREIEIMVDDHIKGWFYLIRELVLYFRQSASGLLALVAPDDESAAEIKGKNRNQQLDLLGPSAAASFRSYSQAIIASSLNEPYQVMGFSGLEAGAEEEFASWLFKIVDEALVKNSSRWHRHSKRGFFR